MKYKPSIVLAYFAEQGLPVPELECVFHPTRKWRFDFAWIGWFGPAGEHAKLAVEVQGGIWIQGRHSRGAALLKEWEKLNAAAVLGWRILYCQPKDLCTEEFTMTIRGALGIAIPANVE